MEPKPVFVVGCPRSGTALLRNLLRSLPKLAIPTESHFIPQLFKAYGDPASDRDARRLARRILHLQWIRNWSLEMTPADFEDCRSYSQVVDRLFGAYAVTKGCSRWGDKTPQNVLHLDILSKLFPDAKILHVIRDGRDVALSWVPMLFGPGNTFTAALEWRRLVSAGRASGRWLGPQRYFEVRYESLSTETETTMRQVCDFIGEPFAPAVLVPTLTPPQYRRPIFSRRETTRDFNAANRVVESNVGKWRTQMRADHLIIFESVAGGLLEALQYPVFGSTRRIGTPLRMLWRAHDQAKRVIDHLNADQKRRWITTNVSLAASRLRARLKGASTDQ